VRKIHRFINGIARGNYPHVYLFLPGQSNPSNQARSEIDHSFIDSGQVGVGVEHRISIANKRRICHKEQGEVGGVIASGLALALYGVGRDRAGLRGGVVAGVGSVCEHAAFAFSIVLTVYLAGLAAGSWLGSRFAGRRKDSWDSWGVFGLLIADAGLVKACGEEPTTRKVAGHESAAPQIAGVKKAIPKIDIRKGLLFSDDPIE